MSITGVFTKVFAVTYTFLSMVFCQCPNGVRPLVNFQVQAQHQTTVGSTIVLFCNATTIGVNSKVQISKKVLEQLDIEIHDVKGKLKCEFKKDAAQSAHCKITIKNIDHSHSKTYYCVAKIERGATGCEIKELSVDVKDCTNNKTNSITIKAKLTKNNTIVVNWNYLIESCDKNIIVYWSTYGPVTTNSTSIKLSNLSDHYEITTLEPNRQYWFGVAIQTTTQGISEIFRSKDFLETSHRCTRNTSCHEHATCYNVVGSYICKCNSGYIGNGFGCSDIDECASNICHINAACNNTAGSFICTCNPGYTGNGTSCIVINPARTDSNEDNISTVIAVVITAFVFLLIIFATIGILILRRKRRLNNTESGFVIRIANGSVQNLGILFPNRDDQLPNNTSDSSERIAFDKFADEQEEPDPEYLTVLDEWEIPRERLVITNKRLGVGQFGVVKKGTYKTSIDGEARDQPVAIKVLKDNASDIDRSDFASELRILKFVNTKSHPNILRIIGACTSEPSSLIITEYCSNGNLKDLLENYRRLLNGKITTDLQLESKMTDCQLLKIAADVACGMKQLASMKFIHRDLAARNILIGEEWVAKISDFGLARETRSGGEYVRTRRNLLPVKWTAIEALVEGKFSTASDIWSYGVLLWEISNIGGEPYKGISPYDIISHVGSGGRLQKPERCSPYLYEIMNDCWETLPAKRPSFVTIYEILSLMLEQPEKLYINVEFMDGARQNDVEYERYTEDPSLPSLQISE